MTPGKTDPLQVLQLSNKLLALGWPFCYQIPRPINLRKRSACEGSGFADLEGKQLAETQRLHEAVRRKEWQGFGRPDARRPCGCRQTTRPIPSQGSPPPIGDTMKHTIRNDCILVLTLLVLSSSLGLAATPMGTVFTYQGRLSSGMNAANGIYDFRFAAWDDASSGVQQGPMVTTNAVGVSNGLFVVWLDFGNVFDGNARWLAISVKTNGPGSYTPLTPRQPLTPAPYALYSPNAGNTALLNGQAPTAFAPATGSPAYVAKAGDTMTGTLVVPANGLRAGANQLVLSGGNVGIGTLTPQAKLEVNGVVQADGDLKAARLNVGTGHTLSGTWATIAGGEGNVVNNTDATVGGGTGNTSSGPRATVAGGYVNVAGNNAATVGGGANNSALGGYSTVAGGALNTANGDNAFVGGGDGNTASGQYATVGGGGANIASGVSAIVAGGNSNQATNNDATVGGGYYNTAGGLRSTVGGGYDNRTIAAYATVAGGWNNTAAGDYATVGGGTYNFAPNIWATIAGGRDNQATNDYAAVGGGYGNVASGPGATIGGGGWDGTVSSKNTASGAASAVGGGLGNSAGGEASAVGGGKANAATGQWSSVGGGTGNRASGVAATISGGGYNTASGNDAAIGGGDQNTASAFGAMVPGGWDNVAAGWDSFAAGTQAKAWGNGSFVWGDYHTFDVNAWGDNEFVVRATGGYWLFSAVDGTGNPTAGATLAAGSGTWGSWCDRNAKTNCAPADPRAVLDKVAALPISSWNYKTQDPSIRHIGPMAQDFHTAFGVGDSDKTITTVDADGVALAAIQGLNQKLEEKNAALEKELAELKGLVKMLTQQVNGGAQ
jgi:hypothetical protein